MTQLSLCLLLVWAAEPSEGPAIRLYEFSPRLEAAIRGQNPGTFAPTPAPGSTLEAPALTAPTPVGPEMYNPFQQPGVMQDPFLAGPDANFCAPNPCDPFFTGINGPQPFRYGCSPRIDIGYLPQSGFKDVDANIEMFELDTELRYNAPFGYGWTFSSAPQFNYRAWNFGGNASPVSRLNLYRFGWDLQLATPEVYGWNWQFDVNPSINTDFESNLTSDAWNFDTSVMAFYRVNPVWQVALGAAYWDRLDDIVIPAAGVIITPDDRWELRLLFPKTRVSYFLGQAWGGWHWMYFSSEYRVESYQYELPGVTSSSQIQYEDWRLALGIRSDHGWFDKYIEAALVLGRNFEFRDVIPKQDVDDGFMVRAGIRY